MKWQLSSFPQQHSVDVAMAANGIRQPDKRRLGAASTLEWVAGVARAKESLRQLVVS